ncbi:MAG: endonuclease/exonuclease/phosphatase family protein [Alistipes communis]
MKRILGLFLLLASGMFAGAQTLTVASYNLRNANPKDAAQGDGWAQRCPVIADLVRFHDFDIFGAQEVLHGQLLDLLAVLPDYDYIGVGRDDGVEKERIRSDPSTSATGSGSLTRDTFGWLKIPPGLSKAGTLLTYAFALGAGFSDRKSRKRFWFFTLHTDHKGQRSQIESCRLVLDKIREMCRGERVVLTGDFNVGETSDCHALLCESGILGDAYDAAPIRLATTGTENWFDPDVKTFRRIDHIFATPGFRPLRYGILTDTYRVPTDTAGKYRAHTPSDHFPVVVELNY